jgi:glucose/arabinose dehydrogenase
MRIPHASCTAAISLLLAACSHVAGVPEAASMGPSPALPAPSPTPIPTVDIAPAVGWPSNAQPLAADGLRVTASARGLDHPRWLYALPNGDVLVAETNRPPRPDPTGLKAWFMKKALAKAGAGVPSANRCAMPTATASPSTDRC